MKKSKRREIEFLDRTTGKLDKEKHKNSSTMIIGNKFLQFC